MAATFSNSDYDATATVGLNRMATFKAKLQQVFFETSNADSVTDQFIRSQLPVVRFVPPLYGFSTARPESHVYTQPLWEMANEYIAVVSEMCHSPPEAVAGQAAYSNPSWRFGACDGQFVVVCL